MIWVDSCSLFLILLRIITCDCSLFFIFFISVLFSDVVILIFYVLVPYEIHYFSRVSKNFCTLRVLVIRVIDSLVSVFAVFYSTVIVMFSIVFFWVVNLGCVYFFVLFVSSVLTLLKWIYISICLMILLSFIFVYIHWVFIECLLGSGTVDFLFLLCMQLVHLHLLYQCVSMFILVILVQVQNINFCFSIPLVMDSLSILVGLFHNFFVKLVPMIRLYFMIYIFIGICCLVRCYSWVVFTASFIVLVTVILYVIVFL